MYLTKVLLLLKCCGVVTSILLFQIISKFCSVRTTIIKAITFLSLSMLSQVISLLTSDNPKLRVREEESWGGNDKNSTSMFWVTTIKTLRGKSFHFDVVMTEC